MRSCTGLVVSAGLLTALAVALASCGDGEGREAMSRPMREGLHAELRAEAVGPAEECRILVTLANVGSVPFTVDKDLVFGLRVEVPDVGVPTERWEHQRTLDRADLDTMAPRFVKVQPGQTVTREINLSDGFAVLWRAVAMYTDGTEGTLVHEYVVRLPEGCRPSLVFVDYSTDFVHVGAFRTYTGLDPSVLTPLPERLTATVSFP